MSENKEKSKSLILQRLGTITEQLNGLIDELSATENTSDSKHQDSGSIFPSYTFYPDTAYQELAAFVKELGILELTKEDVKLAIKHLSDAKGSIHSVQKIPQMDDVVYTICSALANAVINGRSDYFLSIKRYINGRDETSVPKPFDIGIFKSPVNPWTWNNTQRAVNNTIYGNINDKFQEKFGEYIPKRPTTFPSAAVKEAEKTTFDSGRAAREENEEFNCLSETLAEFDSFYTNDAISTATLFIKNNVLYLSVDTGEFGVTSRLHHILKLNDTSYLLKRIDLAMNGGRGDIFYKDNGLKNKYRLKFHNYAGNLIITVQILDDADDQKEMYCFEVFDVDSFANILKTIDSTKSEASRKQENPYPTDPKLGAELQNIINECDNRVSEEYKKDIEQEVAEQKKILENIIRKEDPKVFGSGYKIPVPALSEIESKKSEGVTEDNSELDALERGFAELIKKLVDEWNDSCKSRYNGTALEKINLEINKVLAEMDSIKNFQTAIDNALKYIQDESKTFIFDQHGVTQFITILDGTFINHKGVTRMPKSYVNTLQVSANRLKEWKADVEYVESKDEEGKSFLAFVDHEDKVFHSGINRKEFFAFISVWNDLAKKYPLNGESQKTGVYLTSYGTFKLAMLISKWEQFLKVTSFTYQQLAQLKRYLEYATETYLVEDQKYHLTDYLS